MKEPADAISDPVAQNKAPKVYGNIVLFYKVMLMFAKFISYFFIWEHYNL